MIPYAEDLKQKDDEFGVKEHEIELYHKILLNRPSKVVIVGILFAILAPILIYHFVYYPSLELFPSDGYSVGSCLVNREDRLPCGVGTIDQEQCHSQCCYDLEQSVCFHRYPSRFTYIIEDEWNETITLTPRIPTTPFQSQEAIDIKIAFDEISASHLLFSLYDAKEETIVGNKVSEKNYSYQVSNPELSIVVNDSHGNVMFNTARGPIIASNNIWEVSFKLTDEFMYGLGEIPLQGGMTKVLYNYDGGVSGIPLIFSRVNGTYHGLLIDVLEATELTFTANERILLRSMSLKGIKFHLFSGPKPKDIMTDVMNFWGFKHNVEYWMLGVHICSDISDGNTFEDLMEFLTESSKELLPFDSHCGVNPVGFSDWDNCLRDNNGADLVKSFNKRFVPHISPYIYVKEQAFEDNSTEIVGPRGSKSDCPSHVEEYENLMLKLPNSEVLYKGLVDNETVVYPDYEFADKEFIEKLWNFEVDGYVLEHSWPLDESSKVSNETYDLLPYFSENFEKAFNRTPQWNITRPNGAVYIYTHNLYSNHFTDAFRHTFNDTIPIWASSQRFRDDIVNRQNVTTSWASLAKELKEAALGSVTGNWLWASPICGDTEDYNTENQINLCVKWYQAATYLPLVRIHSKEIKRHPLSFNGNNKAYIKAALNNRLALLPYFYTTLQEGPLIRPMFFQFPLSVNLSNLITQYSVGEDLLIVPNLLPSQSRVNLHLPPGIWYELWSGLPLPTDEDLVAITTTDADFLVVVRGGAIVVMQKDVKETADATRLNSEYSITIALHCETVNSTYENISASIENATICYAEGKLCMSEGMTIAFKANDKTLVITARGNDFGIFCDQNQHKWANNIKEIYVLGLENELNNYDHHKKIDIFLDLCQLQTETEIQFDMLI